MDGCIPGVFGWTVGPLVEKNPHKRKLMTRKTPCLKSAIFNEKFAPTVLSPGAFLLEHISFYKGQEEIRAKSWTCGNLTLFIPSILENVYRWKSPKDMHNSRHALQIKRLQIMYLSRRPLLVPPLIQITDCNVFFIHECKRVWLDRLSSFATKPTTSNPSSFMSVYDLRAWALTGSTNRALIYAIFSWKPTKKTMLMFTFTILETSSTWTTSFHSCHYESL